MNAYRRRSQAVRESEIRNHARLYEALWIFLRSVPKKRANRRASKPKLVAVTMGLVSATHVSTMSIQDGYGRPISVPHLAELVGTDERGFREELRDLIRQELLYEDKEMGRESHGEPHRPTQLLAWNLDRLLDPRYRVLRPLSPDELVGTTDPLSGYQRVVSGYH